ncbi:tumor necrosis factor receptor superfamily member 6B [Hemicordylus capensis]|uniref:tumor necrosis factor receptor superfamily member 6B n=1 Tax=Hemicordylus capensis TaxID=884348 RepID=UPI00230316FD|nr:tumor necrosis factor receptor superfamily member 6B [Hemicordylus capensis]XP_053106423.1 tumor necrosis factor receptor superfamily member 6B [Hemicordylus capensis]XP_053106424.1 tumor necrosis factor receptor superfamily member 6B [Hemicordylus capensis]XP_053106425.1 tumor necrosis factor receptor superfamily member 6B [Hemicordylus capensis]XP_053106426.1 tumor necrosis factor receptor superfamily member 6B [Hemicordylus capensis]XP_053106427.1 tumor necrosis factor receptor superfami
MKSCCNLHPFRNLSQWVVCSVLLFLGLSSSKPTYRWRDRQTNEILVCQQCPPGTAVAKHCTKSTPTACQPCPELYYTQYWNYLERCLYCNNFCDHLEEEVQPCSATHNRVCQCKPGYYFESDFCLPHTECPAGNGVTQLGSPHKDTECAPCPAGTFSAFSSSTDVCQPHQNCSMQGLELLVPGNPFRDTLCTSCSFSKANNPDDDSSDGSGSEDCQEAVINFVSYRIKSRQRLLRLRRAFIKDDPQDCNRSHLELQMELHAYLLNLKNTEGNEFVIKNLREVLNHTRFEPIRHEIQKRFPLVL